MTIQEVKKYFDICRSSSEAIYSQLRGRLQEYIEKRPLGNKIPSERMIASSIGISREAVRQAMKIFLDNGLLERNQKGTFISENEKIQNIINKTKLDSIGFLMPFNFSIDPLFGDMLIGIEEFIAQKNYHLVIANSSNNHSPEEELMRRLIKSGINGMIIGLSAKSEKNSTHIKDFLLHLKKESFPFVLVDKYLMDLDADCVTTDNFSGAYTAVTHLISLGHRRIAHLTVDDWTYNPSLKDRYQGYERALIDNNFLPDKALICSIPRAGIDCEMVCQYFASLNSRPTAFFISEYWIALQMAKVLRERKFPILKDIALVSFDKYIFSDGNTFDLPRIQSVIQPIREIGKRAAELLLSKIEGKVSEVQKIMIKPKLVVNESEKNIAQTSCEYEAVIACRQ